MKIVCTSNVARAREAFSTIGDVEVLTDREISPSAVRDADVLVVRSKTTVDRDLLEGSRVSFVGTATAGTDHMDLDYLEEEGIAWCAAPGCNANSVMEYIVAALLYLSQKRGCKLEGATIGVIGVGHVGSLVAKAAASLGMKVLLNDPPLKIATGKASFVSLREVLRLSDIVTLHVPLTKREPFPTSYMGNHRFFRDMKQGSVLINTSRGETIDPDALMLASQRGVVGDLVLDVWDNEPFIPGDLLKAVTLGTSHIAGHSAEGKLQGTVAVYNEVCHFLEIEPAWNAMATLPPPAVPVIDVDGEGRGDEEVLWEVVRKVYDIEADHWALNGCKSQSDSERAASFVRIHLEYPFRREFTATQVKIANGRPSVTDKLAAIGFHVVPAGVQDDDEL